MTVTYIEVLVNSRFKMWKAILHTFFCDLCAILWNIAFLKGLRQQESSNVTETLNFSRIYEYGVVKWLEVAVCGKNEAQRWSHGTLPLLLISEGSVNLHSQKIMYFNGTCLELLQIFLHSHLQIDDVNLITINSPNIFLTLETLSNIWSLRIWSTSQYFLTIHNLTWRISYSIKETGNCCCSCGKMHHFS